MSASDWPRASRTRTASTSSCPVVLTGLAMATSIKVRADVSGVRSSWAALATNRRWLAKARSRRAIMSSKVSASSLSSSSAPSKPMRSPRCSCEVRRAAAVTVCSGSRIRRPVAHPRTLADDRGDAQAAEGPQQQFVQIAGALIGGTETDSPEAWLAGIRLAWPGCLAPRCRWPSPLSHSWTRRLPRPVLASLAAAAGAEAVVDERVGGGDQRCAGDQEQSRARQRDPGTHAAAAESLVQQPGECHG